MDLFPTEQQFRTIIDSALQGFALLSSVLDGSDKIIDFQFQYVNDAWCSLCQIPRARLTGRTIGEVLPGHLGIELLQDYVKVVETGQPFLKESQWYVKADRKGKREERYDVDVQAVKTGEYLALIWCDVTGHKRAKEELGRSQLKMKAALDNMVQDFILLDLEGRILAANQAASRDVAVAQGSSLVEGTRFLDFMPESDREFFKRYFGAVASKQHVRLEYPISTPDGEARWYEPVPKFRSQLWT
jgi:PAS domain-containing protein